MKLTAKEILQHIGEGIIYGNPDIEINSICGIDQGNEKSVSYIKDKKFLKFIKKTKSPIIIVGPEFDIKNENKKTLIQVSDPHYAFSKILKIFFKEDEKNDIQKNVYLARSAKIEKNAYIGANSYIDENCLIEENVKIFPNCFIGNNVHVKKNSILKPGVCVYDNTVIGEDCIIHSGANTRQSQCWGVQSGQVDL